VFDTHTPTEWEEHRAVCYAGDLSFHQPIRAIAGQREHYPPCDHLGWLGQVIANKTYDTKRIWPEPKVY